MKQRVSFSRHTRESVQSPLVVLELKVRKGGDFFYGKSSNENHFKAYDHQLVDASAKKIIETVKKERITGERTGSTSNKRRKL